MATVDAVTLGVMSNALRAIADDMEAAMVRSAHSPNITERRDCSTAIFDTEGRMVVQSASIPVLQTRSVTPPSIRATRVSFDPASRKRPFEVPTQSGRVALLP